MHQHLMLSKGGFLRFNVEVSRNSFQWVYLASLYGYNVQLVNSSKKNSIEIRGEIADRIGRANYSTVTEKDVSTFHGLQVI